MQRPDEIKQRIVDCLDAIDSKTLEQLYWFLVAEIQEDNF